MYSAGDNGATAATAAPSADSSATATAAGAPSADSGAAATAAAAAADAGAATTPAGAADAAAWIESRIGSGAERTVYRLLRVRFVPCGKVTDEEEGVRKRRKLYAPIN